MLPVDSTAQLQVGFTRMKSIGSLKQLYKIDLGFLVFADFLMVAFLIEVCFSSCSERLQG